MCRSDESGSREDVIIIVDDFYSGFGGQSIYQQKGNHIRLWWLPIYTYLIIIIIIIIIIIRSRSRSHSQSHLVN